MRKEITISVALVAAAVVGVAIGRWSSTGSDLKQSSSGTTERDVLYWVAPMDPNYRRDEPGKSPMGMDLVAVYADEVDAVPGTVKIDPVIVNNLGVRTTVAEKGPLSRRIETVGYVGYDEDTLQHIHTRVDGWIETLAVKATGDPVERGQLLFELYSPTLVNAQEEYLAARRSGNTTLLTASRSRLDALGVTASEISRLDRARTVNRLISIYSDADGYSVKLGIREGIYVTPATEIMSIAELDQVWVLAEVFERQAAWIEVGQQAEVELDYLPGQSWQGTVDYIYPELDPKTRTLKVRLRFNNETQVLRPNMFARITIFGSETTPVVHVPREALIRGGTVNRVVLALGDGRFRARPVDIGIESAGRVEIRSGISNGDRVVTSGQFLIDSESNIESALGRMSESTGQQSLSRVRIGAVVRGIDIAASKVTLQHDSVPEWSWPAMTMTFDVIDTTLLGDIQDGQVAEVVIERFPDGRHRIIKILPVTIDDAPMDHSGLEIPTKGVEPMDHSGDDMEPGQ